jgi:hypothetical protein
LIFIFFGVSISCSSKTFTFDVHKDSYILVGSGGGFTGIATSYYILPSGELFRTGRSDDSFDLVGKLDKDLVSQVFKNYDFLEISNKTLDEPGNRYYYIGSKKSDKTYHKVTWGFRPLEDQRLQTFHGNVMEYVKKIEKTNKS